MSHLTLFHSRKFFPTCNFYNASYPSVTEELGVCLLKQITAESGL